MSLSERIGDDISSGMVMYTPSKKVPFEVESGSDGVTFHVSAKKTKIRVQKIAWEGILSYLRGEG